MVRNVVVCAAVACVALAAGAVTVRPQATDEALVNPGMGWVFYKYSNRIWAYGANTPTEDTLDWFPGCSTVYLRLTWNDLEPEEGDFRWEIFDTYAQPWIAKGKKVAIRVMTCSQVEEGTPEFVRRAGAKGHWFTYPKKTSGLDFPPRWEPVYDDPVFLAKLENFLKAMAARYDGDPNVAFIDIGSLGIYGEGNPRPDYPLSDEAKAEQGGRNPDCYPPAWKTRLSKLHIDLWRRHFPRTQLIGLDGFDGGWNPEPDGEMMRYCRANGIGFRDDSIFCVDPPKCWVHTGWARQFAKTLPVVVETGHHVRLDKAGGGDFDIEKWFPEKILQNLIEYQASYYTVQSFPKHLVKTHAPILKELARRVGYRLELRKAVFPDRVKAGEPVTIESTWANVGVAPLYAGASLTWNLLDNRGAVVWSIVDPDFDFRSLEPTLEDGEKPRTVTTRGHFGFTTPVPDNGNDDVLKWAQRHPEFDPGTMVELLKPGTYTLAVSVGRKDGKPTIALPLAGDAQRRLYPLGRITVGK